MHDSTTSSRQVSANSTKQIETVSIIGAGQMGRGIASCCVEAGLNVRIADLDRQTAEQAVRELMSVSPNPPLNGPHFRAPAITGPTTVSTSDEAIADADLVIESIVEDVAAKRDLLARIAPRLGPRTIVASNTSSIPLAELAGAVTVPQQFCGLHFCHPVSDRRLVEVVRTSYSDNEVIARAVSFAQSLDKSPVIVGDGAGFALNRIFSPFLTEALVLVLEGVPVSTLNHVATEFGMPCGPLRLVDNFGLDVSLAVGSRLLRAFPDRWVPSELLVAMYKSRRRGASHGGRFYAIDQPDDDLLHPEAEQLIAQRRRSERPFSDDEVRRRLLLPMLLEATRVVEEGLVADPAVVDVILRDGLGMTGRYRGLFGWADDVGAEKLLAELRPLCSQGGRFEPTLALQAAAENHLSFLT